VSEKLKVGILDITGCNGCVLSVAFNEDEVLDIFNLVDVLEYRFVSDPAEEKPELDIVLMEGMVASPRDLEFLKEVRARTKVLVALGTCAHTGNIPAYRKWTPKENLARLQFEKTEDIADVEVTPIDAHVQVDATIPGCPPNRREVLEVIKNLVIGKGYRPYTMPVCVECRRNNNMCLLEVNKPCLGSITTGGCFAICVNAGLECWGCRGQTADANLDALVKMLEGKGFKRDFILERMRTFVGLKIPALETTAG
jgi:coenzyme F420-reducing hydrogenase gamma subunit